MNEHNCRVCGLYIEEPPWGEDGQNPTFEICPCCGVEFGYEDFTKESIKKYRTKWVEEGANWFEPKEKPKDWDMEKQFENIPAEYK